MENTYELLYLYRQGSEVALQEVLSMYQPMIRHIISELIVKMQRLHIYEEDMMQEGTMALMSAIDSYRQDQNCSFGTFAHLVIHRKLCSFLRTNSKKNSFAAHNGISLGSFLAESGSVYEFIENRDVYANPEYYLAYKEALQRLSDKLETLTPDEHDILLAWSNGKSYQQASLDLQIPYKTYDNRLQRLKKELYAVVRENGDSVSSNCGKMR